MLIKDRVQVITYKQNTLDTLTEQLNDLGLHTFLQIEGTTIDKLDEESVNDYSLLLISSEIVYKMVKPHLKPGTPYIVAKRTINFSKVKELLEIPSGTDVYLVNDMKHSAEETICTLEELGIDLSFISFYPQKQPDESIQLAITPGEDQYVPAHIERIYNIGSRLLDITTLVDIFAFFNISSVSPHMHLSARYMQSLLEISKELNEEIYQKNLLQQSLGGIVQHMDDAVLVYNNQYEIEVYNKTAAEYFQIVEKKGKQNLDSMGHDYYHAVVNLAAGQETFVDINGVTYYMKKKRINLEEKVCSTFIICRKAEDYQKIEHNLRDKVKHKNLMARYTFDDIKTVSVPVMDIIKIAKKLAKSSSTILVLGETGTGKEVLAQGIHVESNRKFEQFVGVNFAAISETLMESELFGYESGSFTGARKSGHTGFFEQAHRGTIFLDEIGDAPPVIQNRLLRVLQERQIRKVGGDRLVPIDVRVIAATNKDLRKLVEDGLFREDLYYRLNVLPIHLLPLRERKEDIMLLINLFSKEFQEKLARDQLIFTKEALELCKNHYWPGNIRELKNVVEYLSHICTGRVTPDDLPFIERPLSQILSEPSKEFQHMKEDLIRKGFINDALNILKYLSLENVPSAGRNTLQRYLNDEGLFLTDQQLRYRQKLLCDYGLIRVERGRKGSRIADKGERFLRLYG